MPSTHRIEGFLNPKCRWCGLTPMQIVSQVPRRPCPRVLEAVKPTTVKAALQPVAQVKTA